MVLRYNNVDSIVQLNCQLCLNELSNSNKVFEIVMTQRMFFGKNKSQRGNLHEVISNNFAQSPKFFSIKLFQ